MNVSVAARHMEVTQAMMDHAQEKIGKLPRIYDGLTAADVTLALEAGEYVVEIVAHGRRKSVFVARHRAADMYASMDQAVHKLAEQLRRHKDKVRDRHGPPHEQTMATETPPEA